jgi:hypothetical protein
VGEARRRGSFEERKAAAVARDMPIRASLHTALRRNRRKKEGWEYRATKATVAVVIIAAILIMELLERAGVWNSF